MKKNVIVIFILLITFMSCKKDTVVTDQVTNPNFNPSATPNWNIQYIGSYKGTWTSQVYSMGTLGTLYTKDTTLIISPSTVDSSLTTSLYNCPTIHYSSLPFLYSIYHGSIEFRNDSMLYNCANGGLGAGNKETFKGKKL